MTDPTHTLEWLQLATSAGFTGLAWYLIIYALPKMQERFDRHADKMFDSFADQMDRQRVHHEEVIRGIVERYEKQLDRIVSNGN